MLDALRAEDANEVVLERRLGLMASLVLRHGLIRREHRHVIGVDKDLVG